MNLSEPLEGLTSAVQSAVLRVLARADVGFSGRQVHALARVGSTSSVHRALVGLVRIGLVTAESRPPSIIYRINRDHALWPVIEQALSSRARVFESIREFCAEDLPEELGLTVVVYGSVARRDSDLDSDLDLFVVYPDGIDDDARADFNYQIAQHVERVTGNEAQVFSVERTELADRIDENDPFIENVLADGILVFGPPIGAGAGRTA
jgi:predicted nucleotidyltransferase